MSHNFLLLDAANIRTEDVPKYLDPFKLSPFRVFAQTPEGQLCRGSIFLLMNLSAWLGSPLVPCLIMRLLMIFHLHETL